MIPADFTPIRNPYVVGNPVDDSRMFFGRDDDFAFLKAKINGGESGSIVVLCGTRRSGKTSILFQVLQGRLGPAFMPVLVDLQSLVVADDCGFVRFVAEQILRAVSHRAPKIAFAPLSDEFTDVAYAFRLFCRSVRDALGAESVVLMFDEYELLETRIDEGVLTTRVLELLGETIRRDSGVYLVFTGSEKLEERNAEYWATSLGKSLHRRISFLSAGDAMRLVTEPLRDLVAYEEGVPDRILDLAACQPFYTQVICQGLVDQLNELRSRTITAANLQVVIDGIVQNPLPHMIFTWSALSAVEKVALAAAGALADSTGSRFTSRDIKSYLKTECTGVTVAEDALNEALERLFQNDLLDKSQDGGSFSFRLDLWRLWVARMHPIWQALDEVRIDGHLPPTIVSVARRRARRLLGGTVAAAAMALLLAFVLRPQQSTDHGVAQPDSTVASLTSRPSGAKVFVDNYLLGLTPLDSVKVAARGSWLRFELDGYKDRGDSVDFVMGRLNAFGADLEELTGSILVTSTPAGASVALDGKPLSGATPLQLSSIPTRVQHVVELRMAGYLPGRYANVQTHADSTVTVSHDFDMPRHPVALATTPPGARLFVDEQDVGISPVTLAAVTEGSHEVRVILAGHHEVTRTVEVPAPGNRVETELVPLPPGQLLLRIQPYADVLIDGRLLASETVYECVPLTHGDHALELRHPHFGTWTRSVAVTSGDTLVVQHRFEEPRR